METISDRIKHLKKQSGKTNEQCAEAIGISLNTFKHLIDGKCDNPRMDLLIRISYAFNTTLEWLCFGDSPRVLTRAEMLCIHKYRQLPLDKQTEITNLINKRYNEMETESLANPEYNARLKLRQLSSTLSITDIKILLNAAKGKE